MAITPGRLPDKNEWEYSRLQFARVAWFLVSLFCLASVGNLLYALGKSYFTNPVFALARRTGIPSYFVPEMLEVLNLSITWVAIVYEASRLLGGAVIMILGFFVFWRRYRSPIAIISSGFLITLGAFFLTFDELRALLPAYAWAEIVITFLMWIALASFALAFPTGKLARPPRVELIALGLAAFPQFLIITRQFFPFVPWLSDSVRAMFSVIADNLQVFMNYGGASWGAANQVDEISLALMLGVVAGIQFIRLRQTDSLVERSQLKWVGMGVLLNSIIVIAISIWRLPEATPTVEPSDLTFHIWTGAFSMVSQLMVPLALTIAIVRFQWLNIDLVINRSLVFGGLTVFLAAVFGAFLFLVSLLFRDSQSGPLVAVALTAAVFGAVFHPARRALQRYVDRQFFHILIDYQQTPAEPTGILRADPQGDFGRFQRLVLVGRGGMAEVYQVHDSQHQRTVALKILPAALASDAEYRKRFEREARMMANLQHPNIVRIHEYGVEGNLPFIVMEYLNGSDLGDHLRRVGRIPLAQLMSIAGDVCSALDYAHQQGFVHRDVKPSNVMLVLGSRGLSAVLMDFGIAKILEGASMVTQSGFVGTLDYIAPEQIQALANVDRRADVYSLGVMLYQMATGELPFSYNNTGALLMAHLTQPPPDPRRVAQELPANLAKAIQRAMAKNPGERFSTASEFLNALE
ncbi:MAG: serine/threonine protein kinase [Chloroflexi bacterium]|nr:serine/threonine protein kinase [Chloroflexota bacterium]